METDNRPICPDCKARSRQRYRSSQPKDKAMICGCCGCEYPRPVRPCPTPEGQGSLDG